MVVLIIFTKLMDALFNSYAIPGTKIPKNDATITRKKDEARFKMIPNTRLENMSGNAKKYP